MVLQTDRDSSPAVAYKSPRSGLTLGYHGTDMSLVHDIVLRRQQLRPSVNIWDWLGHGIYFWEHSPSRAMEFAETASKRRNSTIKTPAILGAVIDLGNCLDLLDHQNLTLLRMGYEELSQSGIVLPKNRSVGTANSGELLFRDLDCAVIEKVDIMGHHNEPPFDSVRAVFWEGNLLYPSASFREKDHIQICIRNSNCIKGFFIP